MTFPNSSLHDIVWDARPAFDPHSEYSSDLGYTGHSTEAKMLTDNVFIKNRNGRFQGLIFLKHGHLAPLFTFLIILPFFQNKKVISAQIFRILNNNIVTKRMH